MKRLLLLSICITISSLLLVSFKGETTCQVKYNGIYAFKLDNEYSAVIRFYEDGTVLASTSVNDYMNVFSWFHKDNKDMVLKGKYKIKKCEIKFDVTGMTGEQSYSGTIGDNTITMKLTDSKSKQSTSRAYTFFAL